MPFGFVITRDHFEHRDRRLVGPRATKYTADQLIECGKPFRLLDDDRNLCFEGKYIGPTDESMFSPLDNYGEGAAGCTIIQYQLGENSAWVDL